MSCYPIFSIIYTYGSTRGGSVGCAFISAGTSHKFKLYTFSGVFTAEKFSIYKALEQAEEHRSPKHVL
jgi:hypothetical protein